MIVFFCVLYQNLLLNEYSTQSTFNYKSYVHLLNEFYEYYLYRFSQSNLETARTVERIEIKKSPISFYAITIEILNVKIRGMIARGDHTRKAPRSRSSLILRTL